MKIFHLINSIGAGGTESFLFNLILNDKLNKHFVVVLSKKGIFFNKFKKLKNAKLFFVSSNFFFLKTFIILINIIKILKDYKPNTVNTWMYKSHIYGSIIRIFLNFPLIFHIRHVGITNKHSFIKKIPIYVTIFFANFFASHKVYNSFFSKNNHEQIGFNKKDSQVIWNGFAPTVSSKKKNKYKNYICIGMLSRFNYIKDHKTLIQSFEKINKEHKNLKLILKGYGLNNLKNFSLIKRNKNIIISDPSISVDSFFSSIDIHVLSSYGESFPNVVAESMLRGIPTISSNVGDSSKIVLNNNFLVKKENMLDLSNKLIKLIKLKIKERHKWNQIKSDSRMKILLKFNIKDISKKYNLLWKSFLNNKKILFIIPKLENGGAEKVVSNLMSDFIKKRYKVDLLIFGDKTQKKYHTHKDIKIIYLNKKRSLFSFLALLKIFFKGNYDFALSTIVQANILSVLAKILTLSKIKLIVRETNTPSTILKFNFNLTNFLLVHFRKIYNFSNLIICNSLGVKNDLIQIKINASKIIILPNSLNLKKITTDSKKFIPNVDKPYYVYAGNFSDQKNLELMIETFVDFNKIYNQFSLHLYGQGVRKQKLQLLIKKLNLTNKIKLKKFKPNIYPYNRRSSGLLMSSNWEGMPNIAQEALILNKKVLLTDCKSGPRELKKFGYKIFLSRVNNKKSYLKNLFLLKKYNGIDNKVINKKYFNFYEKSLTKLLFNMDKI